MAVNRTPILGTFVNRIDFRQVIAYCSKAILNDDRVYICLAPAHSIIDCYNDDRIRSIFNASGLTVADGMGVVWILKLKGFRAAERIYGPDLMKELCGPLAKNQWRHYFYGSSDEVLEDLKNNLQNDNKALDIAGSYSPPYSDGRLLEDQMVIDRINAAAPDIIWVGLGSPKQDQWMADHRKSINAPLMIGVGAAFDFVSGHTKQAPVWVQRSGLEWFYRLMVEPRRLWKRYREYPRFVFLVFKELVSSRSVLKEE